MSAWTHAICDACWVARNPSREPVRFREPLKETCCYCGSETTSGIYVRDDPADLRCKGEHP